MRYLYIIKDDHVLHLSGVSDHTVITDQDSSAEECSGTHFRSVSDDGGYTWTFPEAMGTNGAPPHLMRHSSGAVIMTYGRRTAPFGQRALISRDNGETWEDEYILRDDGPDHDLGYPSTVELPDGSLLTVYYQKVCGDRACSLLRTRWSL